MKNTTIFFFICLGSLFLLSYHEFIPQTAFFSGDGGLKYLLLKANIEKGFTVSLPLAKEPWIQALYSDGYYPFSEPFTYRINGENVVSFPVYYLLLNIPFFKWLGIKGLYVIPAVSTALIWLWFLKMSKGIKTSAWMISGAAILIIFGCPIIVYGGVFWEHALASLLALSGLAFLTSEGDDKVKSGLLGFLLGLTCWLRPEGIILSGLVGAAVLYRFKLATRGVVFNACLIITVAAFFVTNKFVYGHFLGVHSLQVVEDGAAAGKPGQGFAFLIEMGYMLFKFFPISIVFVGAMTVALWQRKAALSRYDLVGLVVILFVLATPFFVPNTGGKQWGPRYYLMIMPYIVAVVYQAAATLRQKHFRRFFNAAMVIVIAYSVYFNSYWGYRYLEDNYKRRIAPGIEYLRSLPVQHVIVDDQLIAHEFAVLFNGKTFYLATPDNVERLLLEIKQNTQKIAFITVEQANKINIQQIAKSSIATRKVLGNYSFYIIE